MNSVTAAVTRKLAAVICKLAAVTRKLTVTRKLVARNEMNSITAAVTRRLAARKERNEFCHCNTQGIK